MTRSAFAFLVAAVLAASSSALAAASHAAPSHAAARHKVPTGPVLLQSAPGTPLDATARTLASRDIADSAAHGQEALVLVGSATLSAHRSVPPALFVQLQSAPLCGSAGCDTSVYLEEHGSWRKVLDSVSGPITVLPTAHDHMHDLLVGQNDRWVWSGRAFRDTIQAPSLAGLKRSVEHHQRAVANGTARPPP